VQFPRLGPEALDALRLEQLFVKLEKPLFNLVLRWVRTPSEAADVTQEAFLRIWKARARVDAATVEPLLYRTALNLAANRRRTQRLWGFLGLDPDTASAAPLADAGLEAASLQREVQAAVDGLPESLKRVVLLCEFSELSYAQVGAALGIPAGTVGSRRNKALALLSQKLGPRFGDLEGELP